MLGVIYPFSFQFQGFPALHLGGLAYNGDFCGLIIPFKLPNKKTIFLIVKSNSFENPFEVVDGGTRFTVRQSYLVRL